MRVDEFLSRVNKWEEKECIKSPRKKATIQDKADALRAICEAHKTLGQVRSHIENLFTDPDGQKALPQKLLSTIHRAKGLEWPDIAFLDSHLLPSKYATHEDELQQEANASYIAITRAQQSLHYITSEGIAE